MGFEAFLGNENAVSSVRGMLASGSAPGALLFAGPNGVGKKTLAVMVAKALNCETLTDDFCGTCPHCRQAAEMITLASDDLARRRDVKDAARRAQGLTYFDIQVIGPLTRFILIEQIRLLRSVAYTRPFQLRRRIFILDQAQAIHWQAVDLLLKVLEEPPETTHFILICPNLHELRATLRSRCQRVGFQPVAEPILEELLRNERKVPASQLRLATRIVGGSIAAAKSFDLAGFLSSRKPWLDFLDGVTSKSGHAMTATDWKSLFDATKALAARSDELEASLKVGYSLLRDLLQILETGSEQRIVNLDLTPRLGAWAAKLGLGGVEHLKAGLDSAYLLQTRNINQQLGWEALAIELMA